jgi:hypothetical protein
MSIFSRKASERKHYCHADGREYDDAHLPNPVYGQLFAVYTTGKTLNYDASWADRERLDDDGRLTYTDGSWANSRTGEYGNTGPGELSVSRTAPDGTPW